VFLAYSSNEGAAFIDRALYLPEEWANDPKRRAEAGVPEEVAFANKVELAKRMLQRAFDAGVPARWVLADSFYGRSHEFRAWLEKRGRLRGDGPEDQRGSARRTQKEDRAARRATAQGCLV
jgi:SRSO17 transposase